MLYFDFDNTLRSRLRRRFREWAWRWLRDLTRDHDEEITTIARRRLREEIGRYQDGCAVLTALAFALESLERSPDPVIASRASRHLSSVVGARMRLYATDAIRELPPQLQRQPNSADTLSMTSSRFGA
jgi:hypothetical protein